MTDEQMKALLAENYSIEELSKMSSIIYKNLVSMRNDGSMSEESFNAMQDGILCVWTELMAMKSTEGETK